MRSDGNRKRAGLATVALGALLGLATVASAAPGDVTLHGETTQGVKVKLVVGSAGNAMSFKLGATESHCKHGTLTNKAITFKPLDRSDPGTFEDHTSGTSSRGGYQFKTTTSLGGNSEGDGSAWSGAVSLATKVFSDGKKIDSCKLNVSWNVS